MMKKLFLFCALITAALFWACTSDDNVVPEGPGNKPEEPVVTPEEPVVTPVVPAGFGWSTEANVNLTLESPVETSVSVYSEEDCKENSLLVSMHTWRRARPVRLRWPFLRALKNCM